MSDDKELDVFLFAGGFFSIEDITELLDEYHIDQLQELIQADTFTPRTYQALRPYLTDRMKREEPSE